MSQIEFGKMSHADHHDNYALELIALNTSESAILVSLKPEPRRWIAIYPCMLIQQPTPLGCFSHRFSRNLCDAGSNSKY